jgi:hypothetical protein
MGETYELRRTIPAEPEYNLIIAGGGAANPISLNQNIPGIQYTRIM